MPSIMPEEKVYRVWIKGREATTETTVRAISVVQARILGANFYNLPYDEIGVSTPYSAKVR